MASSKNFFAGVRNVAARAKNYVFDAFRPTEDEDVLADNEVYEDDVTDLEEPAVSMSAEPAAVESDRQDSSYIEANDGKDSATEESKDDYSFGRSFLYAHQNDYTGKRGYDDNSSVAFSLDRDASFGSKRTAVSRPAPSSSVVFGGQDAGVPVSPVTRTSVVTATAGDSDITDTSDVEKGYSYSGAREPARFGSRPITRFDAKPDVASLEPVRAEDDRKAVIAKAVVGFNTTGSTGSQAAQTGFNAQRKTNYGGVTMENMTVQVLKPTEISEATAAGSLLKKGIVVICNLSEIPDKNTRIRFSDFLCGCCKGCDADFSEIISVESPNAVLIAVPSSVTLKNAAPATKVEEKPAPAPIEIDGPDISDIFTYTPSDSPKASSYFDIDL